MRLKKIDPKSGKAMTNKKFTPRCVVRLVYSEKIVMGEKTETIAWKLGLRICVKWRARGLPDSGIEAIEENGCVCLESDKLA